MGQAVVGDAVAQHAAQVLAGLEDGDVVAHDGQVVGRRETSGAAAHHGHAPAGGGRGPGAVVALHVVHGKALEAADVHGVVHHAAAAVHLAGMLAHVAAHEGQRVVLADEAHGVGVAAGLHEADVAGDVHAGRAAGNAGHELRLLEAADVVLHVAPEVIREALDGREGHGPGLVADGTVGRQVDAARGALDEVEGRRGGAVLEHLVEQVVQRVEAHTARGALAAALGRAHGDVGGGELNGARGQRAHRQPPFEGAVQAVHDGLGLAPLHDVQSCHSCSSLGMRATDISVARTIIDQASLKASTGQGACDGGARCDRGAWPICHFAYQKNDGARGGPSGKVGQKCPSDGTKVSGWWDRGVRRRGAPGGQGAAAAARGTSPPRGPGVAPREGPPTRRGR